MRLKIETHCKECGQDFDTIAKSTDRDNWMDAKTALEYGIVDAIFEKRP